LPVDQAFPAQRGDPGVQRIGGHAGFLEIVEPHLDALPGQPGPGALDGVAVGNAVHDDGHGVVGLAQRLMSQRGSAW
jgi:hypothetical protein